MSVHEHKPETDDEDATEPKLSMTEPEIKSGLWGTIKTFFAWRRAKKKRYKKASDGYVQWYLIDDTFSDPKFVKPEPSGAGIPEVDHEGERYLFPREAAVMDKRSGMWTFAHRRNAADPINLRDPDKYAIDADALKEYSDMLVTNSPPGLLDKFNLDTSNLLTYLIVGIIGYAFVTQILGGMF